MPGKIKCTLVSQWKKPYREIQQKNFATQICFKMMKVKMKSENLEILKVKILKVYNHVPVYMHFV